MFMLSQNRVSDFFSLAIFWRFHSDTMIVVTISNPNQSDQVLLK